MIRSGVQYQAPSNWRWRVPHCTCDTGCPDCDDPILIDGPTYILTVDDAGKCWDLDENRHTNFTLPLSSTLSAGWCIAFEVTTPKALLGVSVNAGDVDVHIIVDDVEYLVALMEYMLEESASGCLCFDGENFIATGDFTGWAE